MSCGTEGLPDSKRHLLRESHTSQKMKKGMNLWGAEGEVKANQWARKEMTEQCTVKGKPIRNEKCVKIEVVKGQERNK